MSSLTSTHSLPTDTTIKVSSWLLVLIIALAIHVAAFVIYDLDNTQTQGAKHEGLQGVEIGFKEIALPKQQPAPVVTEKPKEKAVKKKIVKEKKIEKKVIKPLLKKTKAVPSPVIKKTTAVIGDKLIKQEAISASVTETNSITERTQNTSTTSTNKVVTTEDIKNTSDSGESEDLASKSKNSLGGGDPKVRVSYRQLLLQQLERHKRYPNSAMRRGQEGIINLEFVIDQDGNVLSYQLPSPSKYKSLNKAVEKMIKKANPLPKIPDSIRTGALEYRFIAPIKFELN